jgi:hypothetical protein
MKREHKERVRLDYARTKVSYPTRVELAHKLERLIGAAIDKVKAHLPEGKDWNEVSDRISEITLRLSGYAEPGYKDPECGVIATANWNTVDKWNHETQKHTLEPGGDLPGRLGRIFEHRYGVELEWSDEWEECCDCMQLVRTSANSYGWVRSYWWPEDGDGLLCHECVKKDPSDYLAWLEGNPDHALTIDIDIEKLGYTKLEGDFETGFHSGQDASPKLVAKALKKQGIERFIFKIDGVGQFDVSWSVYIHDEELEKFDRSEWAAAKTDGPSISEGLKRALQGASKQQAELRAQGAKGPIYSKCDAETGTAKTREIGPQEWIDGIKE